MFLKNLFKKKALVRIVDIANQWSLFQGTNNGNPMYVRLNKGAGGFEGREAYLYCIGIAIPLKNPGANGLPSPEENMYFNQIEDTIINLFQINNDAVVCMIITTSGMKEFVVYSKTQQNIERNVASLKEIFPKYEFQFYVKEDANWNTYEEFNQ